MRSSGSAPEVVIVAARRVVRPFSVDSTWVATASCQVAVGGTCSWGAPQVDWTRPCSSESDL